MASSAPSVCFVWTSPDLLHMLLGQEAPVGGAEVQLRKLARHLQDYGWRVSFIVSDCGQDDAIVCSDGFTLYKSYSYRRRLPLIDVFASKMPQLTAAMHRAGADLYIQRGAAWLTGHVAATAHRRGAKFAFWFASRNDIMSRDECWSMPAYARRLYRKGLRQADLIIAQTMEQASLLQRHWGLRASVYRNLRPLAEEPIEKASRPLILWVGNITFRKRPYDLLEIAAQCPEYDFEIVGGCNPDAAAIYADIEMRAAQMPNVRFVGPVVASEVEAYYRRAWLLLSTSESEGFSNAFLEAWATGTPVIAQLDPDNVIERYQLGYHCESLEEMTRRTQELCSDEPLRRQIGVNAREYIRAFHAPNVVIPQLDRELRALLGYAS